MTNAQMRAIPSPAQGLLAFCTDCGTNGDYYFYKGTDWVALGSTTVSVSTTVGPVSDNANEKGATITNGVLNLAPANASYPGIVTTGAQTIAGVKTFNSGIVGNVTGDLNGNAGTATKIASITNTDIVQLTSTQTLTNKTLTSPTITGTGAIAGIFTGDLTGNVTGNITGNALTATTATTATNISGGAAGSIPYQTGTGTTSLLAAGSSGQVLTSSGLGTLTWANASSGIPYTGATAAVNLGAYDLTVNGITVGMGAGGNYTNTALGASALQSNIQGGIGNTAIGSYALNKNTTGLQNTANGDGALFNNSTGSVNTANGVYALRTNTTGNSNTANGFGALFNNYTGDNNTAYGKSALVSNFSGSNNTAIGYEANVASGALTNATAIGNGASVNASNKIQLGNGEVTAVQLGTADKVTLYTGTIVAGNQTLSGTLGVGTSSPNTSAKVEVDATNKGVLLPRVRLTGSDDATTIATPATSLLVYNTATTFDVVPGYYYNSGTSGSPVWIRLNTSSLVTGTKSGETINWNGTTSKWQITGTSALALGKYAGDYGQGSGSVALGNSAGNYNQGSSAIALGSAAGGYVQGSSAIALGYRAGVSSQGNNSIAIGYMAGETTQGTNAVAIGTNAGVNNQAANSIILNASGVDLNGAISYATYISPIRNDVSTSNLLGYNTTTNEVTYSAKTFVINHPTKPDNYLVHACLEGPEAGVYYRGESKIENNQSVVVKLPDYVSSFATNFSINITPIYSDDSVENIVYRTSRVKDNSFTVHGKNGSFYWIVYGQRGKVDVEPKKLDVQVSGDGPYKYIKSGK